MKGFEKGELHPSCIIDKSVIIGQNITIGANTIIYPNVTMGDNVFIGANCILGEPTADFYKNSEYSNQPLNIGDNSIIRSGTFIYAGSDIGNNFQCGHRVTIRENSKIGHHCRIGTLSDIQGYSEFGNYVNLHSNVHIGQKSVLGNYVWIFPYTVLTNDPHPPSAVLEGVTVEDFAVIATMVVVLPGLRIGEHSLVGASALVKDDVKPFKVVVGNPAKEIADIENVKLRTTGEPAYPWRNHFERGMPWEGVGYKNWIELQK